MFEPFILDMLNEPDVVKHAAKVADGRVAARPGSRGGLADLPVGQRFETPRNRAQMVDALRCACLDKGVVGRYKIEYAHGAGDGMWVYVTRLR